MVDGYWFTGWAVNGDTDNIYTSGAVASTTWTEDTYFVAQFTPASTEDSVQLTYQITDPATGAYSEIISTANEDGHVAQPADPVVDGYWFTGWAVNGDVDNMMTSGAVASTSWSEDTYFVAQFVAEPEDSVQLTYKVTSPADGSYYEIVSTANEDGHVAKPADPVVDGYWFTGWAVNGDTDNMYTSGAIAVTQWTEDTYFVAQFVAEPEDSVQLTYQITDPSTGAYSEIISTANEDGYVAKPADPVVPGYWFTGWAVNGDTDNIFTSGAIAVTQWTEDTYFVAQFVAEPDEPGTPENPGQPGNPGNPGKPSNPGTTTPEEDCPSAQFPDVDQDQWYHKAVDWAIENGIMNGYADGTFGPNDSLTRAQVAAILYNMAGKPKADAAGCEKFSDCSADQWYARAVAWASENGYFRGYEDGTFGPNDTITREQFAVVFWRIQDSVDSDQSLAEFPDAGSVSGFATEGVEWAVEEGIINGTDDGELAPNKGLSRAEAAAMTMHYVDSFGTDEL